MKGCGGSAVGKTKLDKDRLIMCQREIEQIIANAKLFKQNTNENNMKENLKNIYKQLNILKELTKDVSIYDLLFIWIHINIKLTSNLMIFSLNTHYPIYSYGFYVEANE
jgi:hypothetical protein